MRIELNHSARLRTAIAVGTLMSVACAPLAEAQDVVPQPQSQTPSLSTEQDVLAALEKLSRDTEKLSEDVNHLNGDVAAKEGELRGVEEKLDAAKGRSAAAQADLDALSGNISALAKQRMRGANVDPLTTVLGSSDAQDAIDRSSYVKQMFRNEEAVIAKVAAGRTEAATAEKQLQDLKQAVEKQLAELNDRRADLDRRQGELDGLSNDIRARVDAMDPVTRAAWMAKNNPVTDGLSDLLGLSGAVDAAMAKVGSPYEWGAAGPGTFDCSGLMLWAYQQMGKSIPRTSQAQLAGGTPVSREDLRPGDIIGFYPGITHVGMYVGNGMIVHASDYGIPVQVVPIAQGGPYQGAVRY